MTRSRRGRETNHRRVPTRDPHVAVGVVGGFGQVETRIDVTFPARLPGILVSLHVTRFRDGDAIAWWCIAGETAHLWELAPN